MAKKTPRKKLVEKLDKVFSIYIRRRNAVNDIAECFTCGKKDHWKKLQNGHFQSRKHYSTRGTNKIVKFSVLVVMCLDMVNSINLPRT